jgi:hypothetical protein
MHLYETHLPVANTEDSAEFYVEVVELDFAYRDPGRDIVFLWVGTNRKSMLGLWGPATVYGKDPRPCHFAIAISLPELLEAGRRLTDLGIPTSNFAAKQRRTFRDWLDAIGSALFSRPRWPFGQIHRASRPAGSSFIGSLSSGRIEARRA